MKRKDLFELADSVVVTDDCLSFIETSPPELVERNAFVCAWLTNGLRLEREMIKRACDGFGQYVTGTQSRNKSFFAYFTDGNLAELTDRYMKYVSSFGSLHSAFIHYAVERPHEYAHEILAYMFGGGTGFQTLNSNGAFYRYNLLLYWLVFKLRVWDDVWTETILLPCNDRTFSRAYDFRIFKHHRKTNLQNTVELTKFARGLFGDEFYKLYEILEYDV